MPGLPVRAPNGVPINSANYDPRLAASSSTVRTFLKQRQPAWTDTVVDFTPRPPTVQAPGSASGEVMAPRAGASSAQFRGTGRPRGRPRKYPGGLPHVQDAHDGTPQQEHENEEEDAAQEEEEQQQQRPTHGQVEGASSAQPQQAPQRSGRTAQTAAVLLSPAPSDEPSPAVSNSRESPRMNHNAPAPSPHPVIGARFVHSLDDDNPRPTSTRTGNNGSAPTTPAIQTSASPFLAHPQLPLQSTNAAASIPHSPAPQNRSLSAQGGPRPDGQGQSGHINPPLLPLAPHPGEQAAKRKRVDPPQPFPASTYTQFRHVLQRYANSPGVKDRIKGGAELARFSLLDKACVKEDSFFLALHQIYCMWSSYAQNAYDVLPGFPPHSIDEGLGVMEGLLKKNLTIQPMHRQFFENFPAPIHKLCEPPTAYNNALRQVGRFLHLIGNSYNSFLGKVMQRGYPYLVDELLSHWECYSPVLQTILFTACRRRLDVSDGHGYVEAIESAFELDQRNHAYLYQSSNLNPQLYRTWRNQQELEAKNNELITYYRSLINQVRINTSTTANGNTSISNNNNPTTHNRRLSVQTTISTATGPPMPNSAPPNQAAFTFNNAANPYSPGFVPSMEAFNNLNSQNLPSAQHSSPNVYPSMITSRSPQDLSNSAAQWQQQQGPQLQQQQRQQLQQQLRQQQLQQQQLVQQQRLLYPQQDVQYPVHVPIIPQMWQRMRREDALRQQQIMQQQQQQQQSVSQRQQWNMAAMAATANTTPSAAQLYAARAQAQQQLQPQTAMPIPAQTAPTRSPQVQVQQNPQIQQQPQNMIPREPAPARTPDLPLVPPLGTTIHPSEYAYEASDRRSMLMALHLAHVRSPRRAVVDGESERMYQAVKELVTKPTQLAENVRIYTVPFEVTDEQYRLRVMTDRHGAAIARQPHKSLRWRIRCCQIKNHQQGVVADEVWHATQSDWPNILMCFNGVSLDTRRKSHFGKDLSIELTEMIQLGKNKVEAVQLGKNKVEAVTQNAPSPNFFIAVELIETLRHSTIVNDVWKNRLVPESKTLQIIKDRLSGSGADDEVSVAVPYLSIDLTDPFSSVMFNTPVRGGACTHLECFDLQTFLNTRQVSQVPCGHEGRACACPPQLTSPDKWACPLSGCDKIAGPYDLQIDGFLLNVRKELERTGRKPQYSKALHVEADGKWTVVMQDDDENYDDSDGEDLEPRRKKIKTASATPAPAPSVAGSLSRRSGPPPNVEVIEIDDD